MPPALIGESCTTWRLPADPAALDTLANWSVRPSPRGGSASKQSLPNWW